MRDVIKDTAQALAV